jgi:hypothetical protein
MMWLVEELKLSGIKELINVSVQLFREHGGSLSALVGRGQMIGRTDLASGCS